MTRPRGELTTYRARGGHATDWANPNYTCKLIGAFISNALQYHFYALPTQSSLRLRVQSGYALTVCGMCQYLCWLVVFYVQSTVRSFRDDSPIYCPFRRTWSSIFTLFSPGIEPRAVVWQSNTLLLRHATPSIYIMWRIRSVCNASKYVDTCTCSYVLTKYLTECRLPIF